MKRSVLRVISVVLCLVLAFGVAGIRESSASDTYQANDAVDGLANGYYRIKAVKNGKYLLGNRAGYEAQAATADKAMVFYFKPSDLGEFILYDRDSKYLTVNAFNAIVRTDGLGDNIKWEIREREAGKFTIFNTVKRNMSAFREHP